MISYRLYAVTDRSWLGDNKTLADAVEEAILGGVSFVQLREKELKGEALLSLAKEVQSVCHKYQIPFVINDDVELAQKIDADGVHLGQTDMEIKKARMILGPSKLIGATAKTIEQAREAEAAGANYLGSGAVFGSTTKTDAIPMTMDLLSDICNAVSIPVVAIGGINASNVSALRGLPIAGVAVVSGIFAHEDCTAASKKLLENLYPAQVVQCITNHVTVNQVANMVLTCKASPIMAHHPKEVEEIQSRATALLLNLGATDDYEAMKLALQTAKEHKHLTLIDPVGIAGSTFRRDFLKELLAITSPTVIRGNYAEIRAIYEDRSIAAGLDDTSCEKDGKADDISWVVRALADQYQCVVVATGETDLISDGTTVVELTGGHPLQKKLTGSGCMLSAAIISELALLVAYTDGYPLSTVRMLVENICRRFEAAAEAAAKQTLSEGKGTLTFETLLFDNLYEA